MGTAEVNRVARDIELVWDETIPGLKRAWYVCPVCGRKCRHIYLTSMACRICSGLDYSSRHRHRSIPKFNRLLYLRRKVGVSLQPFTPIPKKRCGAPRYNRIAREICELEARLIGYLRTDINDTLERRIKLRKIK